MTEKTKKEVHTDAIIGLLALVSYFQWFTAIWVWAYPLSIQFILSGTFTFIIGLFINYSKEGSD